MLLAGVFTVLGLGVLLKLGFWQLERLAWKTDLLNRIELNMSADPVPLNAITHPDAAEYTRVCAAGEFLHDREIHLFATNRQGQGGYHIYTPLERAGALAIFVNRGWVPNVLKDAAARPAGQIAGPVTVCGVLRLEGRKGWLMPDNDSAANVWTHRDLHAMAAAAALGGIYPAFIEADESENPGGYPVGGQTNLEIPNNHLGYAVTWFGLALALGGVFAVFVFGALRARK